jgi:hypothetical protein
MELMGLIEHLELMEHLEIIDLKSSQTYNTVPLQKILSNDTIE